METVSIAIAASIDPVVPLYVNTSTTFTNGSWLNKGKSGCGVSGNNAQKFLAASTQSVVYAGNPWSTLNTTAEGNVVSVLPVDFHFASEEYSTQFQKPVGACG